jgi:hypothetical protein
VGLPQPGILFGAAGCRFDFDGSTITPLVNCSAKNWQSRIEGQPTEPLVRENMKATKKAVSPAR